MFTGIVTAIGQLARVRPNADGARIHVHAPGLNLADGVLGESIAVNGVCLTVATVTATEFEADLSAETLARSGAKPALTTRSAMRVSPEGSVTSATTR